MLAFSRQEESLSERYLNADAARPKALAIVFAADTLIVQPLDFLSICHCQNRFVAFYFKDVAAIQSAGLDTGEPAGGVRDVFFRRDAPVVIDPDLGFPGFKTKVSISHHFSRSFFLFSS
jgi:hypothetical protein